jgi:hypothetical protein
MTTEQKHTLATKNQGKKAVRELTGPAAPKVGAKRAAPDIDDYVRREDHEFIKQMFTKQMELTTLVANLAALAPAQAPPKKEEQTRMVPAGPPRHKHSAHIIDDESSKLVADKLDAMLYKGERTTENKFEQMMEAVEKEAGVTCQGEVIQPLRGFMARQRAGESDGMFLLRLTACMHLCVHRGKITYPQHMRVNRYNAQFHLHLFRFFALIHGTKDNLKAEPLQDCRLRSLRAYMKEVMSTDEKIEMCIDQLMPLTEDTPAAQREIKELGAMLAWYHLSIKCFNEGTIVAKSNGRKRPEGPIGPVDAAPEGDDEDSEAEEDADKEEEEK